MTQIDASGAAVVAGAAARQVAPRGLILRYAAFAGLSMIANLGAQAAVLAILGRGAQVLTLAVAAGTGIGFVLKYLLDKHWIFFASPGGLAKEVRQVLLYGMFSVVSTLVFWGMEAMFAAAFHTEAATLAGAAIGLVFGYAGKYLLDRRYTFRPAA